MSFLHYAVGQGKTRANEELEFKKGAGVIQKIFKENKKFQM